MGVKQYVQMENRGMTPPTAEDYKEEGMCDSNMPAEETME